MAYLIQPALAQPRIPSKPTRHGGILFRSKLESEWASLLDRMGYRWVYEKEPFILDSGGYLPDFWLPDLNKWAEVKPGKLDNLARRKLMELTAKTGYPSILMEGPPRAGPLAMFDICPDMSNPLYKGVEQKAFTFMGKSVQLISQRKVPCKLKISINTKP